MVKCANRNILFYIYTAIVLLFSSWTIYYKLPYTSLFQFLLIFFIFKRCVRISRRRWLLFLGFLFISLWFYKPMNGIYPYGILRSFYISSLFFLSRDDINGVIKYLFKILALIVAFGLVCHVLRLVGFSPFGQITTVFTDNRYYDVYPFLVYQQGLYFRFNSIFDEPGYYGTIIALFLVLDNLDFSKKQNIVLLAGGVLTLSFAFYLILGIALLFKVIRNKSILPLITIALLIFCLYRFFPDLFEIFTSRQEFVGLTTGEFTDSRGGADSAAYNLQLIHSRPWYNVLFGNGHDSPLLYARDNTDGIASSSIYRLIFQIGYIGVAYIIGFVLSKTQKNFYPFLFSCLFILSLYQRPEIFDGIYVIMLASAIKLDDSN